MHSCVMLVEQWIHHCVSRSLSFNASPFLSSLSLPPSFVLLLFCSIIHEQMRQLTGLLMPPLHTHTHTHRHTHTHTHTHTYIHTHTHTHTDTHTDTHTHT